MQKQITNYTFDPTNKKVVFTGYTSIPISTILSIVNKKTGQTIFSPSGIAGNVTGNVLTLAYNTTGMTSTDPLIITIDDAFLTTAHAAITTTTPSAEINCTGYNNVRIEIENTAFTSGTNTPSITGSEVSGGTFGPIFRDVAGTMTAYVLPAVNAAGKVIYNVSGVPNFIKITNTISGTLTCAVKVTPYNL